MTPNSRFPTCQIHVPRGTKIGKAPSSSDSTLVDDQICIVPVERRPRTHWKSGVERNMTERQASHYRHFERFEALVQNVVQGLAILLRSLPLRIFAVCV